MDDAAARHRFETFKLGMSVKHGHARSHSRNLSVSPTDPAADLSAKHHRRRSSVSTRRESAELMGLALPDLPPATSDDNINLGEKDSIRRRALWALEGKPDVSFSKVQIPDISLPDVEKLMFDLATKSSAATKRDSFKLLGSSSSSKDTLGTLLEEEEEDDELLDISKPTVPPPNTPMSPAFSVPAPPKHRPSNLNLRPLSLTPDNLSASLPSPSPTPRLRSLALASDDSVKQSRRSSVILPKRLPLECPDDDGSRSRRSSISYKRSSQYASLSGLPTPEMTPTFDRRHSNADSLPSTNSSADEDFFPNLPTRPLSASEQHFLFKSHNALLARITDLERALSMRRRESGGYSNGGSSRPLSASSSSSSPSEPTDEMISLIADLKSERDELKRDVDGWRKRVADLENQLSMLTKRVENERRDAWVARSRVGLLEVHKGVLSKKLESFDDVLALHHQEKTAWEAEKVALVAQNTDAEKRVQDLQAELELVKMELEKVDSFATPTASSFDRPAKKHGLGFMSVDSESSTTDVDDNSFCFGLKSVKEESDEADDSEEENALAGYEDEDEEDMSLEDLTMQSSSSFGSEEDMSRSIIQQTTPRPLHAFTVPRPSHVRRATLSKTWTFPLVAQSAQKAEDEDKDHFFGCLGDIDSDTSGSVPSSPSSYSYEKSKGVFASGFKFASHDDNASFFLPGGVGMPADDDDDDDESVTRLPVVSEEEEDAKSSSFNDDEDMFGEVGGIYITFTPPPEDPQVKEESAQIQVSPAKHASPPPTLPAFDFGVEEEDEKAEDDDQEDECGVVPFTFARSLMDERPVKFVSPPRPRSPSSMIPSPASPSSIPRRTSHKASSPSPSPASTPVRAGSASPTPLVTPPNKRPSFIPQAVSSSSPIRITTPAANKPKAIPTSTFIRQPTRKPLGTQNQNQNGTGTSTNARVFSVRSSSSSSATSSSSVVVVNASQPPAVYPDNQSNSFNASSSSPSPSPSSFSSIMSSSMLSFIPLSWGGAAPVSGNADDDDDTITLGSPAPAPRKSSESNGGYVSREKQLRKLVTRMEREGVQSMGMGCVDLQCRKCVADGGVVVI